MKKVTVKDIALRSGYSSVLALIVADISNPFFGILCKEIEQQAARIRELFDLCKEKDERIAQLESAAQNKSTEDELEAYRRAERTERMARERAEQMQHQANAVLADATARVDEAAALIAQMAEQVSGQLGNFQHAVSNTKDALRNAVAAMGAIRPESDNQ